ncbi:MAG: hypothetical protein NWF14_06355 [Candidatus Bathyarchaeota archaeon]|nr:hypothetical protein [Candidatus Bathyarchaeota archaeon]
MENSAHNPFEPEIKRKPTRVCTKCYGQGHIPAVDEQGEAVELECVECDGSGWTDDEK